MYKTQKPRYCRLPHHHLITQDEAPKLQSISVYIQKLRNTKIVTCTQGYQREFKSLSGYSGYKSPYLFKRLRPKSEKNS